MLVTNIQHLQKVLWFSFQQTNVLNQHQKAFGHLAHFTFSEGACDIVQSLNLHYQKNTPDNYSSLIKMLLLLHFTHHRLLLVESSVIIFM